MDAALPTSTDAQVTHTDEPAVPAKMRAVLQTRYGAPDVLSVDVIPVPDAADDEVLVGVAAGVAEALQDLADGRVRGKVAVRP